MFVKFKNLTLKKKYAPNVHNSDNQSMNKTRFKHKQETAFCKKQANAAPVLSDN